MKDPGYYLEKNDFDVDSAIKDFVSDLNNEFYTELRNHIDNIINAKDLTEEEQELYDSWITSEAKKEAKDIASGEVITKSYKTFDDMWSDICGT